MSHRSLTSQILLQVFFSDHKALLFTLRYRRHLAAMLPFPHTNRAPPLLKTCHSPSSLRNVDETKRCRRPTFGLLYSTLLDFWITTIFLQRLEWLTFSKRRKLPPTLQGSTFQPFPRFMTASFSPQTTLTRVTFFKTSTGDAPTPLLMFLKLSLNGLILPPDTSITFC